MHPLTQLHSLVHPTHPHPHPTHYFLSARLANTGLLSTIHVAASANAVGVVEWICTTGLNDHDIDLEREMAKVDDENGSVFLSSPCIFSSSSSSVRLPCIDFVQRPSICLVSSRPMVARLQCSLPLFRTLALGLCVCVCVCVCIFGGACSFAKVQARAMHGWEMWCNHHLCGGHRRLEIWHDDCPRHDVRPCWDRNGCKCGVVVGGGWLSGRNLHFQ
jgi:hypothetical protein